MGNCAARSFQSYCDQNRSACKYARNPAPPKRVALWRATQQSDAAHQHPDRKEEGVGGGIFVARDGAVVLTVKVAVPEPFAVGVTEFGLTAQVGARFMVGVTAQVRFTELLNPFVGETVMLDVALFPRAWLQCPWQD